MGSNPTIRMDSLLSRNNDIIFSEMDGETVMMSVEKGEYYGINPTGSRIWALLAAPKTVSQLCDVLRPDYDVTTEQCSGDILAFLDLLAEKGIVRVVPG